VKKQDWCMAYQTIKISQIPYAIVANAAVCGSKHTLS